MSPVQEKFRHAFVAYLDDPSSKNKQELSTICGEIYKEADENVRKNSKEVGSDEGNQEVEALVKEAIKDIYITEKQKQAINAFLDKMARKDKEKAMPIDTVLTAATGILGEEKRIISEKHYKVFAAIYSIKSDGHRIIKMNHEAGQAAIDLSEKLLSITSKIQQANKLEEGDQQTITKAYEEAKGHGIEKHRGNEIKNKFHNFCRALSCIFIVPIAVYAYQGSLWAKTKTQKDVENSQDAINEFQQSFQKQ
ncbi:TPA: hypothetical protein ACPSKY_000803 [Legionella bozemanae]